MAAIERIDPVGSGIQPDAAIGVLAVVSRISTAPDTGTAVRLLREAAGRLGADGATFASYIRDDASLSSYRFLLACDPVWGLQYAQNHWWLDDPWLRYAMYNTEPVVAESLPPPGDRARWVTEAASHFGFASTLVVPAPTAAAQSRVGVLCLGSARQGFFDCEDLACWRRLKFDPPVRPVPTEN